jgi:hypothetical protein
MWRRWPGRERLEAAGYGNTDLAARPPESQPEILDRRQLVNGCARIRRSTELMKCRDGDYLDKIARGESPAIERHELTTAERW